MLRALQGDIVETRIIRSNYGISFKELWDPAIHESPEKQRTAEKNKAFDEEEQKWFCTKVMRWYVKKGDAFTKKKAVSFEFYQTKSDLDNLVFSVNLLNYNDPDERPYFVTPDCKSIVTLNVDLSKIPKSAFEVVSGSKGDYYKIFYTIEMIFEAAISFRLIVKGQVLGELAVDYGRR